MYAYLFYGHISFMVLAALSSITAIIYARYFKKKTKKWLKIHKVLGITAFFSFLTGFILAFFMLGGFSGYHFTNLHSFMGLATIIFALCNVLMGVVMTGKKVSSASRKKLRMIHRWIGRITVILVLVTIFMGLFVSGIIYF